uniref:BRCT domain-containing protein n=1 Tax=Chromera velia CCMP2878 TaxID=1169474 RepID=A0A0G4GES9_9ALVE|eukprot:Cvel_21566.t1-p1 / transcript=Cvel_21566.t1 / gene=Cvel_21566 / organism=Chromera_velia_CCMP2878 / gene_product=hypothetical protein / transcript_product=hypothetical protein / location=Cvel_scaffold2034:6344-7519(-) / protein_length=392 / sequence_SO=supercontig / SO=protein_coding / is_pseudo=false
MPESGAASTAWSRALRHKVVCLCPLVSSDPEKVRSLTTFVEKHSGRMIDHVRDTEDCLFITTTDNLEDAKTEMRKSHSRLTVVDEKWVDSLDSCAFAKGRGNGFFSIGLCLFKSKWDFQDVFAQKGPSPEGLQHALSLIESKPDDEILTTDEIKVRISTWRNSATASENYEDLTVKGRTRHAFAKSLFDRWLEYWTEERIDALKALGYAKDAETKDEVFQAMSFYDVTFNLRSGIYCLGQSISTSCKRNQVFHPREEPAPKENLVNFSTLHEPLAEGDFVDSDEEDEYGPWPYAGFCDEYLKKDSHLLEKPDEVVIHAPSIDVLYDRWMPNSVERVVAVHASEGATGFTRLELLKALIGKCKEVNPALEERRMALESVWKDKETGIFKMCIE